MFPPEDFPGFHVDPPPPPPGILLWDGGCGFCARSVGMLRRHARVAVPDMPIQSYAARLPDVGDQVVWVDERGRVAGGTRAISAALAGSGHRRLAAIVLLGPLNPVLRMIYRTVVRYRHLFGAGRCRLPGDGRRA